MDGEEIVCTPGHKFYAPERGWTYAVELKAGDQLQLVNGDYVTVEKVQHEILEEPVKVYNFQVEDFHTYYVGIDVSVLVHNMCPKTVKRGTLTGSLDGLTYDERKTVEDLLNSGKDVEIIPRSNVKNEKTPDFFVDKVKTELKTLNGTSTNTPVKRIVEGFNQGASTVIIDARKTDLTLSDAEIVVNRAKGKLGGKLPGTVEIWTKEGILKR